MKSLLKSQIQVCRNVLQLVAFEHERLIGHGTSHVLVYIDSYNIDRDRSVRDGGDSFGHVWSYEATRVSPTVCRGGPFSSWMLLREDLHDSDFRTTKQHTLKTCGREIKPTPIDLFFHLEAKVCFGRTDRSAAGASCPPGATQWFRSSRVRCVCSPCCPRRTGVLPSEPRSGWAGCGGRTVCARRAAPGGGAS